MSTTQPGQQATSDYIYHLYRSDAVTKNAVITGASGEKLYDIHFAEINEGDWVVSFMLVTDPPQIAMQAQKPVEKADFDVTDYTRNHRTLFMKGNRISTRHFFQDKDGKQYAWESNGHSFLLFAYPENVQIGFIQRMGETVNNQCRIVITGQSLHMLSLILLTGFCIQEWQLEEMRLQKSKPVMPVFQPSSSNFVLGDYQLHKLQQQNEQMLNINRWNAIQQAQERHRQSESSRRMQQQQVQQQLMQQQQMQQQQSNRNAELQRQAHHRHMQQVQHIYTAFCCFQILISGVSEFYIAATAFNLPFIMPYCIIVANFIPANYICLANRCLLYVLFAYPFIAKAISSAKEKNSSNLNDTGIWLRLSINNCVFTLTIIVIELVGAIIGGVPSLVPWLKLFFSLINFVEANILLMIVDDTKKSIRNQANSKKTKSANSQTNPKRTANDD
ncbi:hypothetical protein HDV04_000295 [Boothiomyces sp. JEL0838]|nr:hypothetical protein HDV04_000295 [Boothiomyces sp. JEL0838]